MHDLKDKDSNSTKMGVGNYEPGAADVRALVANVNGAAGENLDENNLVPD